VTEEKSSEKPMVPQSKSNLSLTGTNLSDKNTEIEESELEDDDDDDEDDSEDEDFENTEMLSSNDNGEYKPDELDKIKQVAQLKKESKYLIENDEDLYKSIVNTEKWKTSMLTNKKYLKNEKNVKLNLGDDKATSHSIDEEDEFDENNNNNFFEMDPEKIRLADESLNGLNIDDNKISNKTENSFVVKSVDEMAKLLVSNVMNKALSEKNSDSTNLENNLRHNFDEKNKGKNKNRSQVENIACLTEFNLNKSNSRLSYYREFRSDCDLANKDKKNELTSGEEKQFELEFVDEPDE
jgi:hypothetical protein